ncbi:hypothetical protein SLA2020_310360 [Shorea laevis]
MGETGEGCKSWEEEIFWNHFQSVHFTQFLLHGFDQKLALPEKFAKHFKKKLPETVTLKSPSGFTWDVGLTTNADTLFFDRGWQTFVKDHSLKENDFLIFKYDGVSNFDVLMFDGLNLCEKAGSYFVRKCHTKRNMNETAVEIIDNSSQDDLEGTPKKFAENDIRKKKLGKNSSNTCSKSKKKLQISHKGIKTLHKKKYSSAGNERPSVCLALRALSRPGSGMPEVGTCSLRKMLALDEEKEAQSFTSIFPTFVKIIRKFNIIGSHTLKIPRKFSRAHLPACKTEIVLRNLQGECWTVNSVPEKGQTSHTFCGGWMTFVRDNDIKVGDVCIFELVSKNEMRVHISGVGTRVLDHQHSPSSESETFRVQPPVHPTQTVVSLNIWTLFF